MTTMNLTEYIYILSLQDGSCYVNHTASLSQEITRHTNGEISATSGKDPQLVWIEEWNNLETLQKRVASLSKLSQESPKDLLHILQARLPYGGYHWG